MKCTRFDGQTKITAPRKIDCACGLGNEQVIAALGEIRLLGYDNLEDHGYIFFWSGIPTQERREAGVGFPVRKEIAAKLALRFKYVQGSCCHFLFSSYSFSHITDAPRLPVCLHTIQLPVYHATHFQTLLFHPSLPVWLRTILHPVRRFVNDRRQIVAVWVYWTCSRN